MAIMAEFKDGEFITQTASSTSLSNSRAKNTSGMDADAFLTLLVAEMQNQDPLEPTSNTEWVSQYATFTQVAEIQNIAGSMSSVMAQGLVGQQVILKVTDSAGETQYVRGKVDYVVYEDGKAYLSVNDGLYSIDDLDTVCDAEYMDAFDTAQRIAAMLKNLPDLDDISLGDENAVNALVKACNELTDYQKSFLQDSIFERVEEYRRKIESLKNAADASGSTNKSEGSDKTEDSDKSDKVEDTEQSGDADGEDDSEQSGDAEA